MPGIMNDGGVFHLRCHGHGRLVLDATRFASHQEQTLSSEQPIRSGCLRPLGRIRSSSRPSARACRRRACTREPPPPVASVWRLGRGRAAMRDALPHAGRERACAPAAMHRPAALRPSAATGRPATSPAARPLGGWVGGAGWIAAGPGTGSRQGRPNLEPRAELPDSTTGIRVTVGPGT
jgi:hypothetical protein